ncbi:MAG: glycerol-3-phosphate acyltransferase [Firmicutes bacterium]|nr:glycerol-3-phosphate acyltransferase [Bacillota bacterium]
MTDLILAGGAYLLGTFPSAFLCGKIFGGIDIRTSGSGNVGALNTARTVGLLPGILTMLFDLLKALLAVYLAARFGTAGFMPLLAGLLAVVGHNYNVFLKFKGGKGLASLAGVLILLSPLTILYLLLLYLILVLLIKDTNAAAGVGILSLPLFLGLNMAAPAGYYFGAAIALVIFSKHLRDFKVYQAGRRKIF